MKNRTLLLLAAVLLLIIGGTVLGYGIHKKEIIETPMPSPTKTFDITKNPAEVRKARTTPQVVQAPNKEKVQAETKDCSLPQKLRANYLYLPTICIGGTIEERGSVDGQAEVPDNPKHVAHLKSSAPLTNSEQGTSIIYGHVSYNENPGALYDLAHLYPGARFTITDAQGSPHEWMIVKMEEYKREVLPDEYRLPNTQGPRRMVLITCGGKLITTPEGRHYESNTVAVAVPL